MCFFLFGNVSDERRIVSSSVSGMFLLSLMDVCPPQRIYRAFFHFIIGVNRSQFNRLLMLFVLTSLRNIYIAQVYFFREIM